MLIYIYIINICTYPERERESERERKREKERERENERWRPVLDPQGCEFPRPRAKTLTKARKGILQVSS